MNTNNHRTRSHRTGALRGLALLALTAPFIAAPTPGNVGGCGSSYASTPVAPLPGNVSQTAEAAYFEQGLCAHFCRRLFDCGLLCRAVVTAPANCETDANAQAIAFHDCVHGENVLRTDVFGGGSCPKSCGRGSVFASDGSGRPLVYQWDVQVCGDAVLARSCSADNTDPSAIATTFTMPNSECASPNVCRSVGGAP
ncbi:MAG: hypothetical protein Q8Q09_29090 [Deltaproteobacteria bacterium]|nr:hypothetical protein [Deltaproteobacteria bacterium]